MNRSHTIRRVGLPVLIGLVAVFGSASGQWEARFGLPPVNPNSGLEMRPQLIYDGASGLLSIANAGENGIVDSQDNTTLAGDDVGMISVVITVAPPVPLTTVLPIFADGIAWAAPVNFDGRVQVSGNAPAASFLPVAEQPTGIVQLPAGLQAIDFVGDLGEIEIEIGINHQFGVPGLTLFSVGDPIASGAFAILPGPELGGDFNLDNVWDCSDIDALVAEIDAGTSDPLFDLDDDGVVGDADVDAWLGIAGNRNIGSPYIRGDGNLDGFVDGSDFNIWNSNKFVTVPAWCMGDFNASGSVDTSDFNVWNEHKFTSSFDAVAVPEPEMMPWFVGGLLSILLLQRRQMDTFLSRRQ